MLRRKTKLSDEQNRCPGWRVKQTFLSFWSGGSQHIVTRTKNHWQAGVSRENNATTTCARELFLLRQITLFHIMWTRFKQIFLWFMRRRSLHELVSSHICDYICNNIVVIHTHILVPWWKKWQRSEKNQRSMIHWYLKSKLRAYQPGYRRNRNFILFQLGNMVGCGFHKSWDRLQ